MIVFRYSFMVNAFIIAILLALILPCIGIVVTFKRLSMIGDAFAHVSLSGVAIGLLLGVQPVLASVITCILAALAIEFIRNRLKKYAELSISIIMSLGIGLATVLSGFIRNALSFESFLFGSILTIDSVELKSIVIISLIVLLCFVLFYKELFLITFDERSAKLLGVPIKFTNFMFMTLTAITISISSRVAGVLIVSAMMVIPVACALLLASSYFQAVMLAVCFALVFNVSGIFLSFHFNIKPSGAIVLTSIVMFFIIIFFKEVFKRYEFWRKKNKTEKSYNESLRG